MIKAKFSTDAESGSISLVMTGHAVRAGEGEGQALVCASASMLSQTLAQLLLYLHAEEKMQKEPHIVLRPGRCQITAKPKAEAWDETLYGFFVIEVGLDLLARNHRDFVQVTLFDTAEKAFSKDSST